MTPPEIAEVRPLLLGFTAESRKLETARITNSPRRVALGDRPGGEAARAGV